LPTFEVNPLKLDRVLRWSLEEDVGRADVSSWVVPPDVEVRAELTVKDGGVASGSRVAARAFEILGCRVEVAVEDGDEVEPGDVVLTVEGRARDVLAAERTALNFFMRMSGIATATREVVRRVRKVNPEVRVAATRKVHPITGFLEKKAVADGGGDPHRFGLDDAVLIKDNHLAVVGSVREAVKRAREIVGFTKSIGVEVETPEDAVEAAEAGADHVLLDNMTPDRVRKAVKMVRDVDPDVILEASGGITPSNVEEYASTGVDVISMGWLTHSAPALDASLRFEDR